ncbi:hypothetical protein PLESTB_001595600 [Pleodorina starrii]|uniref:SnoaL-like domain-containing protein n=1 Tax=Pleodorina starrii TaxID=330485 RepID=A0A9W6F8F3_9CHLO|nr:hypothetical protein PLESTM_000575400 [Pleodorina starrii]GLC60297.1 hypothetical protein PLESTB_001595600 [Pleodorina starrii]GLC66058.1 hypothetical protein PLESTF_000377100 [Pleodorina starrii]
MKTSAALGLSRRSATKTFSSRGTCCSIRCRTTLRVIAFKERDDIQDWRVKQMVDTCHVYYSRLWSRGDIAAADALLDPKFVYRDLCSPVGWVSPATDSALPPTGMVVGPRALKALVEDVRTQYPDFYMEVEELAVSDTHRIFVNWVSHGTQLGPASPADSSPAAPSASSTSGPASTAANAAPSHHNSSIHGVDVITFNHDRSRMLEVNVFRQLSSDERRDVERRLAPNPLEIRLARLHWDRPQQKQQPQQKKQPQPQQKQPGKQRQPGLWPRR